MLKSGVQTKGILEEEDLEYGYFLIREAGFECVDLNLDSYLKNDEIYQPELKGFFDKSLMDLKRYFDKHIELLNSSGLIPSQMHAPYPVDVYGRGEQNTYMRQEVIPKSLAIAGHMEIPYVVIHPLKRQYIKGREEERRINVEYFKTLIPSAREYGVMICFENLYEGVPGRLIEGVCADPLEACWYVDTLNDIAGEERFGFCLDTGHLNLVKRKPYDAVKKLGSRLKILHIHENDRISDQHQMPYTFSCGNGEKDGFDWDGFIRGLKEINYEGVLNFETFPCLNSFPVLVRKEVLGVLGETGKYFAGKIAE